MWDFFQVYISLLNKEAGNRKTEEEGEVPTQIPWITFIDFGFWKEGRLSELGDRPEEGQAGGPRSTPLRRPGEPPFLECLVSAVYLMHSWRSHIDSMSYTDLGLTPAWGA